MQIARIALFVVNVKMRCAAHFSLPSFLELDKHTMAQPSTNQLNPLVPVVVGLRNRRHGPGARNGSAKGRALQAVTKGSGANFI